MACISYLLQPLFKNNPVMWAGEREEDWLKIDPELSWMTVNLKLNFFGSIL